MLNNSLSSFSPSGCSIVTIPFNDPRLHARVSRPLRATRSLCSSSPCALSTRRIESNTGALVEQSIRAEIERRAENFKRVYLTVLTTEAGTVAFARPESVDGHFWYPLHTAKRYRHFDEAKLGSISWVHPGDNVVRVPDVGARFFIRPSEQYPS